MLGPEGPLDMYRMMGNVCQLPAATVGAPADFPGYIENCPGYVYAADGRRAFFRVEDAPSLGKNPTQVFTAPEGTPPQEGTPQAFDEWSAAILGSPGERVVG